jgi:uncharacterized membrane protein YeaQ/YmgE (transglycosylase-associated protein family)
VTLFELAVLLLVAGVSGAIGQSIAGMTRGGCLTAIALGFIGALLGTYLARHLGLPELFTFKIGPTPFPVIWAIIGATLFSVAISLLTRNRRG